MTARLVSHREHPDPFVRFPRHLLENPSLSWKAKGLLAWLLDKGDFPGGWETEVARIVSLGSDGKAAVRAMLAELELAGYLERLDEGKGGRGRRIEWHVTDDPKASENRIVTEGESPIIGQGESENRDLTPHYRETSSRKTNTARVDPDLFEAFWFAYPRKLAKAAALKAWKLAVRKASAGAIMAGLDVWAPIWAARGDPSYTPYPATWLNGERWNDEPTPVVDKHILSDAEFDDAWAKVTAGRP